MKVKTNIRAGQVTLVIYEGDLSDLITLPAPTAAPVPAPTPATSPAV